MAAVQWCRSEKRSAHVLHILKAKNSLARPDV